MSQVFVNVGNDYHVNPTATIHNTLPVGAYEFGFDPRSGRQWFTKIDLASDTLVDIPSREFEQVVGEMNFFLKPSTRKAFSDHGFIYKRSALLYGLPGTGKTCIVQRVAQEVIRSGGIVLFNTAPQLLALAYKTLDDIQPDVLTMVIFEEFDELIEGGDETRLLSLLDGEVQKRNVMYLMTTNFIDKVPSRILRPGRISSMVEVKFPDANARLHYLNLKVVDKAEHDLVKWVEVTEGFSIDELKETVLAVCCLGQTLTEVVDRINSNKGYIQKRSKRKHRDEMKAMNIFESLAKQQEEYQQFFGQSDTSEF